MLNRGVTLGAEPAGAGQESRQEAWDRFYAYCFEIISSSPAVRRLSGADREDCIQDVMLEIVRKFGTDSHAIRAEDVTGWVRAVSRNKAADIARRRMRKPESGFEDGSGEEVPQRDEAASEALSVGESISIVWEALLALDHQVTVTSYLVFFLRQIEGWSVGEVAEMLQIAPEQVRFRTHRVKTRFAEILKSHALEGRPALEGD
jgi:RNA polymerase sigma factor (sigma-70 family)